MIHYHQFANVFSLCNHKEDFNKKSTTNACLKARPIILGQLVMLATTIKYQ